MYSRALSNCSSLVRLIFIHASQLVYTFSGYNHVYGHTHLRNYSDIDVNTASIIRHFRICIRLVKSLFGPCLVISFSLFFFFFFFSYTYFGVCNNNNNNNNNYSLLCSHR